MSRLVWCVLVGLLLAGATAVRGEEAAPKIRIVAGDWGKGSPADIHAVCSSAAREFFRHFPKRKWEPISVSNDQRGPMVVYGVGDEGERRVLLNTRDTFWCQYAFQFSHECGHIACNYRQGNKANLWFEEALCETASLFTLRQMAQKWKTDAPYANWKEYSAALDEYAAERIAAVEKPDGMSLAAWYRTNEAHLRKTPTDRAKNQVVAVALLPLLEKEPAHWQAVSSLNQTPPEQQLTFAEYLRDWHRRVPQERQPFVAAVAKMFEVEVD